MKRRIPPMSVTLLEIKLAYTLVFDREMPMTLAYSVAAEEIRKARPDDWDRVFLAIRKALGTTPTSNAAGKLDYSAVIARARELLA